MTSSFKGGYVQQQHRAVFDAFTVGSSSEAAKPSVDPFVIRRQSTPPAYPTPSHANTAWTEASKLNEEEQRAMITVAGPMTSEVPSSTDSSTNTSSMIFSPPNCIDDTDDRRGRPATSWARGREPVKVAGDVSLTGAQLVPFLVKATMRLPSVKGEGVQLRLRQLVQLIDDNALPDPCIKKLNFVVDALDRGAYEEAWRYYEGMRAAFPVEMSSNWSHGVRLLIRELMPQQRFGRVRSAGGHVRNQ